MMTPDPDRQAGARTTGQAARLSRERIVEVVGRLDDWKITALIDTGATVAELQEAEIWLSRKGAFTKELERPLSEHVGRLYEILTADQPEWPEGEKR